MAISSTDQQAERDLRSSQRLGFIKACGLDPDTNVDPLAQDASFRQYFRLSTKAANVEQFILMDAPPQREQVAPFIKVLKHLESLGLRPPRLLHADIDTGFLLLEDLGQNTYTRLLNDGMDPAGLYSHAVDVLTALHEHESALDIDVPDYDTRRLVDEAALFTEWYAPAVLGRRLSQEACQQWREAWESTLSDLPACPATLVLRDFHVDNLMRINLADMGDNQQFMCALLDFQDAVAGSPAYDLVSLLEDARRDLSPELVVAMRQRYFDARQNLNSVDFDAWYQVLGAQRHAKVLGIFMRLWIRDNKPVYIEHMPRVTRLFLAKKDLAELTPISEWLTRHMPNVPMTLPTIDVTKIRSLCEVES